MPLKLKTLKLSWFRGAGKDFVFDTKGKSVGIYGPNGSGKSSLVDALEYVLSSGKIGHLANEYSGKRLEHAVPNTHAPHNAPSYASIVTHDGNEACVTRAKTGMPKSTGNHHVASWDPTRSILRQDTVAGFVMSTKADKYKALLPLLGLEPFEVAASNLRAIKLEVDKASQLDNKEGQMQNIRQRRQASFPDMNAASIGVKIKEIFSLYLPDHSLPDTLGALIAGVTPELQKRLDGLDAESRAHALMCQVRDAKLGHYVLQYIELSVSAVRTAHPLLAERLAILRSANIYTEAMPEAYRHDIIECPACGQSITAQDFVSHVNEETKNLADALEDFRKIDVAHKNCVTALQSTKTALRDQVLEPLWVTDDWQPIATQMRELIVFEPNGLEGASSAQEFSRLKVLLDTVMPFVDAAAEKAPASTQTLIRDRDAVKAASDWDESRQLRKEISDAKRIIKFLEDAEASIRGEIRLQAATVIRMISSEVASMWKVLHPDVPIDEVGLYQHADADKAIDVTLRFHGTTQQSPRLTLSEGHRNSLGLCVFLALAKKGEEPSPIILDDVVTSFDREHRASVTDLLINHMDGFQIIVFTHEHDWFIDLHNRLPGKSWSFEQLRPFSSPAIGLQWSISPVGFEPARALLDIDAAAAANKARGLLDQHLAIICERLKISMPFVRGPRNELRHADEMLQRFATRASDAFRQKTDRGDHSKVVTAAQIATDLKRLLVPFANPPSHGRIATRGEAERIINQGESFLAVLKCSGCEQTIYRSEVSNKHLECECGSLRWVL